MQNAHSPGIGLKRPAFQISARTLAILQWGGLAAVLAGIGLLVAMNMSYARARYPGSQAVGQGHVSLLSAFSGRISETGTYQTHADLATVRRWYQQQFQAEAPVDDTVNIRTGCSTMMKTQQWIFVRRAFQATLCSQPAGTSVYLYQTVYLWR